MSTHSMLGTVFNDVLRVVTPSQEDWEIRFAIINDLRSAVESVETMRGEHFRSFVSRLLLYCICINIFAGLNLNALKG